MKVGKRCNLVDEEISINFDKVSKEVDGWKWNSTVFPFKRATQF